MTEKTTEQRFNSIETNLVRIESTLSHVTDAIEQMAEVVNKPRETKWGPIISGFGMMFIIISGYATLTTTPLETRIEELEEQHHESIEREIEDARAMGVLEGRLGIEVSDELRQSH